MPTDRTSGAMRTIPWLFVVAGLGIPFVAGGFAGWPYVVGWIVALAIFWAARRASPAFREIGRPAILLPILFVLGIVGGWYLIPADLAWLAIDVHDHRGRRASAGRFPDMSHQRD